MPERKPDRRIFLGTKTGERVEYYPGQLGYELLELLDWYQRENARLNGVVAAVRAVMENYRALEEQDDAS